MDRRLLEILGRVSPEEERILGGRREVEQSIYTSHQEFVVDRHRMLPEGALITVRTHTRFIDFPLHRHNFIEVMYLCQGSVTHLIGGDEVVMEQGDLLFLNQHTRHAIRAAGQNDIGINLLVLPAFFDTALQMLDKDNVLADFLIGLLRQDGGREEYLHFRLAGNLQTENLMENLVYSLVYGQEDGGRINGTLMGLLFLYLLQNTKSLRKDAPNNYEDVVVRSVLRYIDGHYQTASLGELSENMGLSLSHLSRFIRQKTGCTFKELLQRKRFQMAMTLLCDTALPVTDIAAAVGYENNSYFHRRFRQKNQMSPGQYRALHQKGGRITI